MLPPTQKATNLPCIRVEVEVPTAIGTPAFTCEKPHGSSLLESWARVMITQKETRFNVVKGEGTNRRSNDMEHDGTGSLDPAYSDIVNHDAVKVLNLMHRHLGKVVVELYCPQSALEVHTGELHYLWSFNDKESTRER